MPAHLIRTSGVPLSYHHLQNVEKTKGLHVPLEYHYSTSIFHFEPMTTLNKIMNTYILLHQSNYAKSDMRINDYYNHAYNLLLHVKGTNFCQYKLSEPFNNKEEELNSSAPTWVAPCPIASTSAPFVHFQHHLCTTQHLFTYALLVHYPTFQT